MGRITDIAWTATAVPELAGFEKCPGKGCRAELFEVGGITYHPGATFNPWWGCTKVDAECVNCYAKVWDRRWGGDNWGPTAPRRTFGPKHWSDPVRFHRHARDLGVRLKVFCASMADVFEARPELDSQRERLWRLIDDTPDIDWLLLTKRPENFPEMLPGMQAPPNCWLGVTAGTQESARIRIPLLLNAGAAVRFVSAEPLLEPLYLWNWLRWRDQGMPRIDWVIAGAESGPGARPAPRVGFTDLRDQCDKADVPYLLKQFADSNGGKIRLPALDGVQHFAFPALYAADGGKL